MGYPLLFQKKQYISFLKASRKFLLMRNNTVILKADQRVLCIVWMHKIENYFCTVTNQLLSRKLKCVGSKPQGKFQNNIIILYTDCWSRISKTHQKVLGVVWMHKIENYFCTVTKQLLSKLKCVGLSLIAKRYRTQNMHYICNQKSMPLKVTFDECKIVCCTIIMSRV